MPTTIDYDDRLLLAAEQCRLTCERRDNFLSDSDVLDAADAYTTDAPWADEDSGDRAREDYDRLANDLFAWLAQSAEEETA